MLRHSHPALPIAWVLTSFFIACSPVAEPDASVTQSAEAVEGIMQENELVRNGKQFIPQLGIFVPLLPDYTMDLRKNEVLYRSADGLSGYALSWESDPEALFQRFIEGIPVGDMTVMTNGQTEDWGNGRTAFATFYGNNRTGDTKEYRINVWENGHTKGMFYGVAYLPRMDEAKYALAKKELLDLMDGVEHLSAMEEERIKSAAAEKERKEMAAKRAAIGTRNRDADEARLRQELTGLALVDLSTTVSNSSFGNSSLTTLDRFQLCPSGEGSWTFGSDMVILAERTNNQGDISDVGSMTSTTKNRAIGMWDVERYKGRLLLTIYTYDGQEKNWNLSPGEDQWSYIVGGKKYHVSKVGGTYGPECR